MPHRPPRWNGALLKFMAAARLNFGRSSTIYRAAERAHRSGRYADLDYLVCAVLQLCKSIASADAAFELAEASALTSPALSTLAAMRETLFDLLPRPPVVSDERQYDPDWRDGPDDLLA